MTDKSNLWDFKRTKWTDWLIAFLASLILVNVPALIFQFYSEINMKISTVPIGLVLCFLIMTVLKERREKRSSGLQNITLGLIFFLIILDIIIVIIFFAYPPATEKNTVALADIKDEYYNLSLYYGEKIGRIELQSDEDLAARNFSKYDADINEHDKLHTELINTIFVLCNKTEKNALPLEGTELADLNTFCKHKNILLICKDEKIKSMKSTSHFFEGIETKTNEECIQFINSLTPSKNCQNLYTELGTEGYNISDSEALCYILLKGEQNQSLGVQYQSHILNAKTFWAAGDYQRTITEGELALNYFITNDEKSAAHYWIGVGYYKLNKLDEAQQHEELAIELYPGFSGPYVTLGAVMLSKNNYQKAQELAEKSIELDPTYPWAHNLLGSALILQGMKEEGIIHINKAIELEPTNQVFQQNLKYYEKNEKK